MKNIKELANLAQLAKLKVTDLLLDNPINPSNTDIFFHKILDGDFHSDQDAADFFFQSNPNHSNYKNLKHKLKEKLINRLFFLNPKKSHSDYGRALVYCAKNLLAAKILAGYGVRGVSLDLCQKVFLKAEEFELTEYLVDSSKILRNLYSGKGDSNKFNFYNLAYKKYFQVWQAEALAEEYYSNLTLPYVKLKALNKNSYEESSKYFEELRPFLEKYHSPRLYYLANLIRVVGHLSINDYESTIKICQEALDFFKQKNYSYGSPIVSFSHNMLLSYIQLKDFKHGKIAALNALGSVRPGYYSWYLNQELYLTLSLHAKEYQEAYIIFNQVINHHRFNAQRTGQKERWLIHQAYIHFLIAAGKIQPEEKEKRKFRLGKFLNSVPIYSKDKRGLNIPILVAQILFMIINKNYDDSIERFEAIKKYCSRYMRQDDNLRSNCFINMLLQIPLSSFHKAGIERRAKKYYDKLKRTPLDVAAQAHEIEIMPYEDLWEIVISYLDTKIYKSKKY